jgi:hypothetical protein
VRGSIGSDGVEGGGCAIVDSPGRDLIGVLYSLDADDARRLLAVDGYVDQYEVRNIEVTAEDGSVVGAFPCASIPTTAPGHRQMTTRAS